MKSRPTAPRWSGRNARPIFSVMVEEPHGWLPSLSEETTLAEKRTVMMQAEKVAADLRDVHDAVAGAQLPVPTLAAAVRRLERRSAQALALIEPAVKALDAALTCAR